MGAGSPAMDGERRRPRRRVVALTAAAVVAVTLGWVTVGSRLADAVAERCGETLLLLSPSELAEQHSRYGFVPWTAGGGRQFADLPSPAGPPILAPSLDEFDPRNPVTLGPLSEEAFLVTADGRAVATSTSDGTPQWGLALPDRTTTDVVGDRMIVTTVGPTRRLDVVTLDTGTGDRISCVSLGTIESWNPAEVGALSDDDVIVKFAPAALTDSVVVRLHPDDGTISWRTELDTSLSSHLSVGGDTVVVDSQERWEDSDFGARRRHQEVAAHGIEPAAGVVGLDARTGAPLWSRPAVPGRIEIIRTVTADGTILSQLTDLDEAGILTRQLQAGDAAGAVRWTTPLDDPRSPDASGSPPMLTVVDDVAVVTAAAISGLDLADGRRRWTVPTPPSVDGRPAGQVVIGSELVLVAPTALQVLDPTTGTVVAHDFQVDDLAWVELVELDGGRLGVGLNGVHAVVERG